MYALNAVTSETYWQFLSELHPFIMGTRVGSFCFDFLSHLHDSSSHLVPPFGDSSISFISLFDLSYDQMHNDLNGF